MKNNSQFFEYKRKRRKHYEMRIENEESEFPLYLRKTMNILRSINPLKLEYKNIFSIISPYLVIKDFPSSYKFKYLKNMVKHMPSRLTHPIRLSFDFIYFLKKIC